MPLRSSSLIYSRGSYALRFCKYKIVLSTKAKICAFACKDRGYDLMCALSFALNVPLAAIGQRQKGTGKNVLFISAVEV
jgi:hypothetical protein